MPDQPTLTEVRARLRKIEHESARRIAGAQLASASDALALGDRLRAMVAGEHGTASPADREVLAAAANVLDGYATRVGNAEHDTQDAWRLAADRADELARLRTLRDRAASRAAIHGGTLYDILALVDGDTTGDELRDRIRATIAGGAEAIDSDSRTGTERRDAEDLLYAASVLLSNGADAGWSPEDPEWAEAAKRWRDAWRMVLDGRPAPARGGAAIAADIRAELVCCDMYDRVQRVAREYEQRGDQVWIPEDAVPGYHAICHWGEAAARIAEAWSPASAPAPQATGYEKREIPASLPPPRAYREAWYAACTALGRDPASIPLPDQEIDQIVNAAVGAVWPIAHLAGYRTADPDEEAVIAVFLAARKWAKYVEDAVARGNAQPEVWAEPEQLAILAAVAALPDRLRVQTTGTPA